jgi:arylsulfatase A-like enzyme
VRHIIVNTSDREIPQPDPIAKLALGELSARGVGKGVAGFPIAGRVRCNQPKMKFRRLNSAGSGLASGLCLLAAAAAAAASAAVAAPASVSQAPGRPNVLFIAVDDLNDWIGALGGHPQARTPNIDALARRGVIFANAHCAAPVCLASRTAIFAGRFPEETGVYSNWPKTSGRPPTRELQLPVRLMAAGYDVLAGGKLYHGFEPSYFSAAYETEQRWSPFTLESASYLPDELPSKGSATPRHVVKGGPGGRDWTLPLNGMPAERNLDRPYGESFDWGPVAVDDSEMGDTRVTDWAISQLAAPRSRPLFLGVGYYRPHIPLFAPQRDFDALPPESEIVLPETKPDDLGDVGEVARQLAREALTGGTHGAVVKHGQWRQAVRAYLACIGFVDRQIGRLIERLDASPYADNTWIVLWSDHGWHLGEKEHWGKWTPWRASTRSPLIVVPPRRESATRGARCAEPVSLVDLYPTLLEVAGASPVPGLQAASLLPLLQRPERDTGRAVVTTVDPGNHALSTKTWRYLRYANGDEELYDIVRDPREWRNLAADPAFQAVRADLRRRLDETLAPMTAYRASAIPPAGGKARAPANGKR